MKKRKKSLFRMPTRKGFNTTEPGPENSKIAWDMKLMLLGEVTKGQSGDT